MAAANTYRAKTCTFASDSKLGLTSLRVSVNGQTTDFTSDAAVSVTAIFVDAIKATVTAQISDMSDVQLVPGDTGALVIVFQKRAEGRAPAGSGDITGTFANAVVTSAEYDAPGTGVGGATITWECSNPSSGSPVAWT